jgi:hypothetical protein
MLALYLSLGIARADTTDFTGDFAPAFWTNYPPGFGSVYFTNSNTELVLSGANQPSTTTSSTDPIYYGLSSGGLSTGGTIQFTWQYDSPDGLDDSASFAYTGDNNPVILAQGTGATNGTFSIQLSQGDDFAFLLDTETPAGKPAGTLIITSFSFQANVPEPSTEALLASALIFLGYLRWRRAPRPS